MKTYIINTDCQVGHLLSNLSFAKLALELQQAGHEIKTIQLLPDGTDFYAPEFEWYKTEHPPVPQWLYKFSSGDPAINGKQVVATSFQEAAKSLGCKVQFAIPFSAHCSAPNGKATVISWNLDPIE